MEIILKMDYKYKLQVLAEEIAEDEYGQQFYDLSESLQDEIYSKAIDRYWSRYNN